MIWLYQRLVKLIVLLGVGVVLWLCLSDMLLMQQRMLVLSVITHGATSMIVD